MTIATTPSTAPSPHIHVCIISGQPLANLLPLLFEKPERAIFLASPEMTSEAERLKKIVQPRGIGVDIKEISSAYDFEVMVAACQRISDNKPEDAHLTLNATGGTKVAALAAFQVFFFENQRIIYLDSFNKQLLQLAPAGTPQTLSKNLVKVRDCLRAYGMNPLHSDRNMPINRRAGLAELVELLIINPDLLSRLNSALDRHTKKTYANIPLNDLGQGAEDLATMLEKCGVATLTRANTVNIPKEDSLFFCHGGWLEEYVYWSIKDLSIKGLDLAMNVEVDWEGRGQQTTRNEFDVLFTHANGLRLISCKASNPDRETESGSKATEALNELDTLKDRAGGLFGKAMLVSARHLRDADRERARKMNIELVDGQHLLSISSKLKEWLKS